MTLPPLETYAVAKVLADLPLNGELARVSEEWRRRIDRLVSLDVQERAAHFETMAATLGLDFDVLTRVVAAVDPTGPVPDVEPRAFATIADVRRGLAEVQWHWDGWIPKSRIVGVGAFEGTGKTRFALDLFARSRRGEWPDGQACTLPADLPSVWVCSDAHQDELAEMLPGFGLPDESIIFPTTPEDPYGGVDIDHPDTLAALDEALGRFKPAFLFIDTLTSATSMDLCDQRTMKPLKTRLAALTQRHGVTIVLLLHLSREGQALGRRIKGLTRTLIHLEAPDPEQPTRLKLWVEKSYAKKPPPLGVTMRDGGNDYDFNPPRAPDPVKAGRPSNEREKAKVFILAALRQQNDQIGNHLVEKFDGSRQTFWRAVDDLAEAGEITVDGGKGTGEQKTLHLGADNPPIDAF